MSSRYANHDAKQLKQILNQLVPGWTFIKVGLLVWLVLSAIGALGALFVVHPQ